MPKICPNCRKKVPTKATLCPHCDEDLIEDDDEGNPAQFLVPINTSVWAILAFYAGLLSCFPFIGLLFGIPAIVCGIVALRKQSRKVSYGSVTGNMRAIIGIVCGSLGLVAWTIMAVVMFLK